MLRKVFILFYIIIIFGTCLNSFVFANIQGNGDIKESVKNEEITHLNRNDYLRDTAIYYSAIWAGRLFYVRNKNSRIFDTSFEEWWDNISQLPKIDDGDQFFTNYVVHPYIGSMSYLYYRQMGHEFWPSAFGSLLQSTLFEYTVEGLVETPSLSDMIATPGLGVPLGYFFEITSNWFESMDNGVFHVAAKLINPMKLIVDNRKVVLFNPLTGNFEFKTTFQKNTSTYKNISLDLSYPLFFESAVPRGYFTALIEVADLDNDLTGELILYHIRAEFPSENYNNSIYIRLSQGGVNDTRIDGEEIRDGFELANLLVGFKSIIIKNDLSALSVGFEVLLPTAYKDNVDRLETLILHNRDFPIYLKDSFSLSSYTSFALWQGLLNLQGNLGTDLIILADEFENDSLEWRIKYALAAGANFPVIFEPLLYTEVNGYTLFTSDKSDKTDIFLTTGIRFGNRISPGIALQFPLTGETSELVDISYIMDLRLYF